jgi:hypothetical protein
MMVMMMMKDVAVDIPVEHFASARKKKNEPPPPSCSLYGF